MSLECHIGVYAIMYGEHLTKVGCFSFLSPGRALHREAFLNPPAFRGILERRWIMGRPRRFKTVKELEEAWEAYKDFCDNQIVLTHDFSARNSEFISKELKRCVTYTIEGFCVFAGIARAAFYDTYAENKRFSDMVTRMREECEIDARMKFETGRIPSQLAGLWMSRHGYTTKTDANVFGAVPVVISGDDALED